MEECMVLWGIECYVYNVLSYIYMRLTFWDGVKVKCTLVQALRLCTGRTAHRESRGIALPFHDHGTRSGWGVSVTPRPLFTPGRDPVPIVQEAGVGARAGPDRCGKSRPPTEIRSPNRPARSRSLYRLRYPARLSWCSDHYKQSTVKCTINAISV